MYIKSTILENFRLTTDKEISSLYQAPKVNNETSKVVLSSDLSTTVTPVWVHMCVDFEELEYTKGVLDCSNIQANCSKHVHDLLRQSNLKNDKEGHIVRIVYTHVQKCSMTSEIFGSV